MRLDWAPFELVAETLALQGFNVIPLPPRAKGAGGSGVTFRHLNKHDSRRVTAQDLSLWKSIYDRKGFKGVVGAYILPSSGQRFHFAIVDVDDHDLDDLAVEFFGDSPLHVSRNGKIKHRYFITTDPRGSHLMSAFGKRTVDVISTTGAVLPGSVHEDGYTYELSIPIDEWTPEWVKRNVPEIDLKRIAKLREVRRGTLRIDLSTAEPVEGSAEGFIHAVDPIEHGDSVWCGHVLPSTTIVTTEGRQSLAQIAAGTKCFATYRDDAHPSSHVSDYRGTRYFWDMSTEPKRYWTMIESLDKAMDPELSGEGEYYARLEHDLRYRLGVEVEVVSDSGWLSDQLEEIADNETVFLIAPHGSGKTILARREHDKAKTSISVCNTQALTIANAAVLNLKPVYDGVDELNPKGSVCIPSLPRYERPPEFFHVDEADAVHGFLHSGKVDEPLKCWRVLAYFSALSSRCLIASADLSYEDIALFTHAIRERNATRRIRVVVRVPDKSRCRLCIRSLSTAKEALHQHVLIHRDDPVFIGITTRKLAGEIAQGYRVANTLPVIDLDEVANITNVIDSPEPYALEAVQTGIETSIERPFFVSGENNRYHRSVRWLENTDELIEAHDLIVTSPAVQSGVSLDKPISKVFILHENRDVPADAVLQIARRPRNPVDTDIVLGVRRWRAIQSRTDRPFLDGLLSQQSKTTIKAILDSFPSFEDDHAEEIDAEFAWSWRITTRKMIRSYSDPIGALVESAQRHGWDVDVETESDGDSSEFNQICAAARSVRTKINSESVSGAEVIGPGEQEQLKKAPKLMDGERQKLDRASLKAFYEMDVTPELVVLDNSGRYRNRVRAYTHVMLVSGGMEQVVAYLDHSRSKGKQPSQRTHDYAKALLLSDLLTLLPEGLAPQDFDRAEIREPVRKWWKKNRQAAQTFFPRLTGPTEKYEARWLGDRLRSLGATVDTYGASKQRRTKIDFERVDLHAAAYAARLFTAFERVDEETWLKEWKNQMEV